MDLAKRHEEYAQAFESFLETDDESLLEPFFTENAVHAVGEPFSFEIEGREAIIAAMRDSVNGLDRRCDSRELEISCRAEDGCSRGQAAGTFRIGDSVVRIEVEEIAYFEGDRISRLEDHFSPASQKHFAEWIAAHGLADT